MECHATRTEYNVSLATKLSLGQFMNTALMLFLIKVFFVKLAIGPEEAKKNIYK